MRFVKYIKNWLAWKIAGDELRGLHILKRDIEDLKVWCSHNPDVSAAARWLQDFKDYPYQMKGPYGSIVDFRTYLDELDKEKSDGEEENRCHL